jgi:formylmethanofuran dehydrogenase subunit E-like metal-binding protein
MGNTTECCIRTIERITGCSISDGNLLPVHRSVDKPLWFAIFDNETKDCVYAVYKNGAFTATMINIWNPSLVQREKVCGLLAFNVSPVALLRAQCQIM